MHNRQVLNTINRNGSQFLFVVKDMLHKLYKQDSLLYALSVKIMSTAAQL